MSCDRETLMCVACCCSGCMSWCRVVLLVFPSFWCACVLRSLYSGAVLTHLFTHDVVDTEHGLDFDRVFFLSHFAQSELLSQGAGPRLTLFREEVLHLLEHENHALSHTFVCCLLCTTGDVSEFLDCVLFALVSSILTLVAEPQVDQCLRVSGLRVPLLASLSASLCWSESVDSEFRICEFIPAIACVLIRVFFSILSSSQDCEVMTPSLLPVRPGLH